MTKDTIQIYNLLSNALQYEEYEQALIYAIELDNILECDYYENFVIEYTNNNKGKVRKLK